MTKNNNSIEKYAEEWVPIRQILNGMIQLDNGLYVSGVKIKPKNIFISEEYVQVNMINNLKNLYNSIDYEFWLIIADRPVDLHIYLSQLQLLYKESNNPISKKIIIEDINKANSFMSNSVVDTEYFLLFKEKENEVNNKRVRNLINNFANAGLTAFQTTNDDLRMILDNFLNGGQTTNFGTVLA